MISRSHSSPVGVLTSGGLDSCILVGDLLRQERTVQPFYIRTGLTWQDEELPALERYLAAVRTDRLLSLVTLDLPLADLYTGHWSLTGRGTPDAESPDEAVFLPGRNALLLVKAAVYCQLHGITQLALAPLGTSPFEDAGPQFLREFQTAMNRGGTGCVELLRPFGQMNKRQVMQLGNELPLQWTFSCIHPVRGLHCGKCNKCAERQQAFGLVGRLDPTEYAA
ncbi:queuosine biosynthesis protein QueC [Anatilimnocola aggregata]|uniref:7-cyano-7-deazaguanine synthase n=1 Tax=Anatilimnocola aggregata TaxID=2528021 RepID=A0A517YHP1_9BACT|nr:7-cyano-7-deazaguanine synthase [Anatilimnocola aggregata]QDU29738.1 queuosine biosynthesis protein QueC [Anatilimnocola aggregata]